MAHAATAPAPGSRALEDLVARIGVGVQSGLVAGIAMLVATQVYAVAAGMGLWAPLRMMATVVGAPMDSAFSAPGVIIGLAVHLLLSMAYGAAFALVLEALLYERDWAVEVVGALFGMTLYLINFYVFASLPALNSFAMMRGNIFEIAVHALFGLMLAIGFLRWRDDVVASLVR